MANREVLFPCAGNSLLNARIWCCNSAFLIQRSFRVNCELARESSVIWIEYIVLWRLQFCRRLLCIAVMNFKGTFCIFVLQRVLFYAIINLQRKSGENPVKSRVSHQFFFGHERQKERHDENRVFLFVFVSAGHNIVCEFTRNIIYQ